MKRTQKGVIGEMNTKQEESVWETKGYYDAAREHILSHLYSNSELRALRSYVRTASHVLDCGCGDGTLLETFWRKDAEFWGVDISKKAIALGKNRLKGKKNIHFQRGDIGVIEFPDAAFDLVYAHDVLEHLGNPEKTILEMIRVTRKGGILCFISPNYGSPLYPSPSSPHEGRKLLVRALGQVMKSFYYLVVKPGSLRWLRVEPRSMRIQDWEPDWDTMVEPYIQTLIAFLQANNVQVVEYTSIPDVPMEVLFPKSSRKLNVYQRIEACGRKFAYTLGKMGTSPFTYFGSSLFVIGEKQ